MNKAILFFLILISHFAHANNHNNNNNNNHQLVSTFHWPVHDHEPQPLAPNIGHLIIPIVQSQNHLEKSEYLQEEYGFMDLLPDDKSLHHDITLYSDVVKENDEKPTYPVFPLFTKLWDYWVGYLKEYDFFQ